MWLNRLFIETPINFEKRCRNRIIIGVVFTLLGLLALILAAASSNSQLPILYLEPGSRDLISGFYSGTGAGLTAAGIITIIKNIRYLKKPELKQKQKIYETDERNRMIGLRCWAYTGYTMMLSLYIGILISGFISITVMKTLLAVAAIYAVILLTFRLLLQKTM